MITCPPGHRKRWVAELDPGIDDDTVLGHSHQRAAVLLTSDKDFGDLVFRRGLMHSGVVLLRLEGLTPEKKATLVVAMLDSHGFTRLIPGPNGQPDRAILSRRGRPSLVAPHRSVRKQMCYGWEPGVNATPRKTSVNRAVRSVKNFSEAATLGSVFAS